MGKYNGFEDGFTINEFYSKMAVQTAGVVVKETNNNALGECTGRTPESPNLSSDTLKRLSFPLALHGVLDLMHSLIRLSIELGVCKININTGMRLAYLEALKKARKQSK